MLNDLFVYTTILINKLNNSKWMKFHEGYKLQSNLVARPISALHSQFTFSTTEGFLISVINTNASVAYVVREM